MYYRRFLRGFIGEATSLPAGWVAQRKTAGNDQNLQVGFRRSGLRCCRKERLASWAIMSSSPLPGRVSRPQGASSRSVLASGRAAEMTYVAAQFLYFFIRRAIKHHRLVISESSHLALPHSLPKSLIRLSRLAQLHFNSIKLVSPRMLSAGPSTMMSHHVTRGGRFRASAQREERLEYTRAFDSRVSWGYCRCSSIAYRKSALFIRSQSQAQATLASQKRRPSQTGETRREGGNEDNAGQLM